MMLVKITELDPSLKKVSVEREEDKPWDISVLSGWRREPAKEEDWEETGERRKDTPGYSRSHLKKTS